MIQQPSGSAVLLHQKQQNTVAALMDTSSFPSTATFILISGFYHAWQRFTGTNLLSLIQNLIQVYGPWMNVYLGQLYMEDENNPSLYHTYRLTQRHIREYGYGHAAHLIPHAVATDVMHDLLYLLGITESMRNQQIMPTNDWRLFQQFFDHWAVQVMRHHISEWEDQEERLKAVFRTIAFVINHKDQMYNECKRLIATIPIQHLDALPQYIRAHFTLSSEWGHVHMEESQIVPTLSTSEESEDSDESPSFEGSVESPLNPAFDN